MSTSFAPNTAIRSEIARQKSGEPEFCRETSNEKTRAGFICAAEWLDEISNTVFGLQHRVNEKKKITVTVEQNGNCSQGISISGDALGGQQLCADSPQGVGDHGEGTSSSKFRP
jgi:hypothetical protein